MTFSGPTPSREATESEIRANSFRAARPRGCRALGFAGKRASVSQKAASTAGSAGVLAA